MIATLGWSQETPKTVKEESVKAEPEAAGETALSAEESEELQRLSGKKGPQRSFEEFIVEWMTPKPFDKRRVVKIDDRYAYPHVVSSIKMEIVREDDEFIWLRGIPPEDPNSALYPIWAKREADEAVALDWKEIADKPGALNFLDFGAVAVPPPEMESLRFEPSGAGNLPDGGRWQMGFAVADMNEDGHSDLVFPPRRKQYPPSPAIFLGDGKGIFDHWEDAKWPENMPWDYGGVAVADLNNDGHQDVVFAAHFKTQFALLGNGEGRFPSGGILPSPDPRLSSRAVTAADFDGDGSIDLGFVSEIDYDMTTNARIGGAATVWVLFNRGDTWEISTEGLPTDFIADVIRSADLDGDGRPELVLSSNTLGPRFLVFTCAAPMDGSRPSTGACSARPTTTTWSLATAGSLPPSSSSAGTRVRPRRAMASSATRCASTVSSRPPRRWCGIPSAATCSSAWGSVISTVTASLISSPAERAAGSRSTCRPRTASSTGSAGASSTALVASSTSA